MNRAKLYLIISLSVVIVFILIFKMNFSGDFESKDEREESIEVEGNRIRISDKIRNQLYITTQEVDWTSFSNTVLLNGEITVDPDSTQSIGTRLPGRIVQFKKKEGDWVKKGEVLIVLDSPEVAKLRSKYNASLSKFKSSEKNALRVKNLSSMKLASDQEVRNAITEAKNWEMELISDRESMRLMNINPSGSGTQIYFSSPMSGTLTHRLKAPGDIVSEHTNLAIISNLSQVWFEARVFEKDLSRIQLGRQAKIMINAYPNETWLGSVSFIGSGLDRENRSVAARITIPNKEGKLKLGLFGKAILGGEDESLEKAIFIPENSLLQIESNKGVFVALSDLEFEWRILGDESLQNIQNGKIPVLNGLKQGELIVTNGAFALKSLMLKSTFGDTD
ncbi:MAG: efflux RND transporter periplasmic adaptor subunit [Leptospira sp.]|nr:efflux RND transporter periplasmic adaptor subunit [Leptospira sp.]